MNKAEKEHLSRVVELGCIACRRIGYKDTPAGIHHIRAGMGMAQRNDNYHVLPLCGIHHQTGGHGVAIHSGQETWEAKFGTEEQLLEWVNVLLEMES